ncbi:MAG: hypothetical protein HY794_03385 [Desulfarculus sp.]|nr:hypothetical protein [Desulfarculus sp.]
MQKVELNQVGPICHLWLDNSRLVGGLTAFDLKVAGVLSLEGSWLGEELVLHRIKTESSLFLTRSVIMRDANLSGAIVGDQLSMRSARLMGKLNMDSLSVGTLLLMDDNAAFFGETILRGAKIGVQCSMNGSVFEKNVYLDWLAVGKSGLLMGDGAAFKGETTLLGADIAGDFYLRGATFNGKLSMDKIAVSSSMFMDKGKDINTVFRGKTILIGAKIGGALSMEGATFGIVQGKLFRDDLKIVLTAETISVGSVLSMRDASFNGLVRLGFGKISGVLLLEGATFESIDFTGTKIGHIICRQSDWPQDLKLDGLTYGHLGGEGEKYAGDHMTSWPASWFIKWLAKQKEYSPQPYEQCAKVLREAGQAGKANRVLFAGKVRERQEAWKHNKWRWAGLWVLQAFIGHGLGAYMFLSLIWVLGLALAGTYVIHQWPPAQPGLGWPASLAYSLDMLLPFVKVAKAHESIVPTGWAAFYFYFHKLMGWLLGFFVVAGLTGLTKKS